MMYIRAKTTIPAMIDIKRIVTILGVEKIISA